MKEVTVLESPITTRYVNPGSQGQIDEKTGRIRVGGVWFEFRPDHWKVVTEEEKQPSFIAAVKEEAARFLTDKTFNQLIEAYAITEDTAMEWMIETGDFIRDHLRNGWMLKE